jgi:transglutaminase-like putative cysteine protease
MWRFAQFDGRSSELCFESIVILEHSPADAAKLDPLEATWTFPVAYSAEEKPDLADCIQRRYPDPDNEVERWTRQFLHFGRPIGTLELVSRLSEDIHQRFFYRRREAKGIQLPHETLRSGHGSCRDFALLMIEAARSLGLAARFASGYLALPSEPEEEPANDDAVNPAYSATHAWAQVYLPSVGWRAADYCRYDRPSHSLRLSHYAASQDSEITTIVATLTCGQLRPLKSSNTR